VRGKEVAAVAVISYVILAFLVVGALSVLPSIVENLVSP